MKKFSKLVALGLSTALAVGTLAGCTNSGDTSASGTTTTDGDTTTTTTTDTQTAGDDTAAATDAEAVAAKKVFCYFGPAWLIDFCMDCDKEGSVGAAGNWRVTPGPQGFYWGGTWICAANGTDNADLVADIIKTMTSDKDILTKIITEKSDFVNSASINESFASDESFGNAYLGGQNPYGIFSDGVSSVDLSNISNYDQVCNEEFQKAMKNYFDGNCDYDTALQAFYTAVTTKNAALAAPGGTPAGETSTDYEYEAECSNGGSVLNIYAWNTEFLERFAAYYPGYVAADENDLAAGGKIGDVTVKFTIVANEGSAYQDAVDAALLAQADADDDDKVDIFLVEADYALKYVNTNATLALKDLGITDLGDQYKYTQDVVTDGAGRLKGSSWQGCPGALIYRADLAEEVLGSSDPAVVQESLKDWTAFAETANKMAEKGYNMTSTTNDTYRVFSNNVSQKWVVDGIITVDDNLKAWVDMSKAMVDAGQTTTADLWSDTWSKGFYMDPQ